MAKRGRWTDGSYTVFIIHLQSFTQLYAAKEHDLTYFHNAVTMGDGLILRAHLKRFEVC